MAKKIPGLAHEVNLAISGGIHNLDLILRGTVLVSTPIKSRSEQGIRKALDVLVTKAEISHQIQSSFLDNLARTLTGSEIPLGILTSLIGAPFFVYLLKRTKGRDW